MRARTVKLITIAFVFFAFALNTFGQATATATATIIAPISIVKVTDMSFGNVARGASLGTVQLSAAASPTRTAGGGVTLSPANPGTVTAASFTVGGQAGYTYSISLPASASLTGPGTAMTADAFSSSPSSPGTIGGGGTQTLYVGATLNVNANQAVGVYTSAAFTVTVNYN